MVILSILIIFIIIKHNKKIALSKIFQFKKIDSGRTNILKLDKKSPVIYDFIALNFSHIEYKARKNLPVHFLELSDFLMAEAKNDKILKNLIVDEKIKFSYTQNILNRELGEIKNLIDIVNMDEKTANYVFSWISK